MEIEIKYIDSDSGIAMIRFDAQTTRELVKEGCKHLLFFDQIDEEGNFQRPYITNYRETCFELDKSKLENCSARIFAVINVYFKYINNIDAGLNRSNAFSIAVKETAKEMGGINVSSVYDKISRQMSITSYDFRMLLEKAYKGDISALQDKLRKYTVNIADIDIVENYLPEINKING